MNDSQDILSVIFLALVAIIIAGISHKLLPNNSILMVPTFVFICMGLWIAFDHMLLKRYKAKERCLKKQYKNIPEESLDIDEDEMSSPFSEEISQFQMQQSPQQYSRQYPRQYPPQMQEQMREQSPQQYPQQSQQPVQDNQLKINTAVFNQDQNFQTLYPEVSCPGDNQIANRMKYMGIQPQLSQIFRASYNKYSLQPFLEEELQEHSEREWWNSDHLDMYM